MDKDKLPAIPFNAGHPDGGVQPIPAMTQDKWMAEARRWAKHAYCYEGMVGEFPDWFGKSFQIKLDPYAAVDAFADMSDLDRCDGFYGINSGKKFEKRWVNSVGSYYAEDGTLMNADGTRSIFDDVDG